MDDILKLFGVIMAAGGSGILLYGMYGLVAWVVRKAEAPPASPETEAHLRELEERVAELAPLQDRVLELEERLDFAERVLANPEAARQGAREG